MRHELQGRRSFLQKKRSDIFFRNFEIKSKEMLYLQCKFEIKMSVNLIINVTERRNYEMTSY